MLKKTLLCSALLLGISACAYITEDAIQDVSFTTPGAKDALCYAYIDDLRYKFSPPEVLTVHNSKNDMTVDCMAPGNRRRKIYVKAAIAESSKWNVATAGAGYAYDYMSGALFKYPQHISIDFTNIPVTDQLLPTHNNPDIRQPEDYPLEEFLPSSPRLNSDKDKQSTRLLRRGEIPFSNAYAKERSDAYTGHAFSEGEAAEGKGSLMKAADPSASAQEQSNAPMPLIPGE